jgi:hypothetical protein
VPALRASCAEPDVGPGQGVLHLASAFPRPVWLDHLLPLLTIGEAVMLRATCKAMRALVAEMRADLGERPVEHLKAMLTCFPKADAVELHDGQSTTQAEQDSLIAWLKEQGHSLTSVLESSHSTGPFVRRAWRAGVFKSVTNVDLCLDDAGDRDLIILGLVSGVESIDVRLSHASPQVERAALGYLRHFAALKDIRCTLGSGCLDLPPFIPPSLEDLSLDAHSCREQVTLLGCLLPMVESSGAKLRRLEMTFDKLSGGDVARGVGRLIRSCASTLTSCELHVTSPFASAEEVVEALASCRHLVWLKSPVSTFVVLPPGRSVTFRVRILHLSSSRAERRPLSSVALWGLMARGGFANLTVLWLDLGGWRWGVGSGPALVEAFEGVSGTLKKLVLHQVEFEGAVDGVDADGALRQLGEAIGRLHRLEELFLNVGQKGLIYHQLAQGLAEGSCPALRSLTCIAHSGHSWLGCRPSIILPSVQDLTIRFKRGSKGTEPLAVAFALTSLGYRGSVVMQDAAQERRQRDQVLRILNPLCSSVKFEELGLVLCPLST